MTQNKIESLTSHVHDVERFLAKRDQVHAALQSAEQVEVDRLDREMEAETRPMANDPGPHSHTVRSAELSEARALCDRRVDAGLLAWETANESPKPLDTPQRIAADAEVSKENAERNNRLRVSLKLAPTPLDLTEDYRALRRRALAFAHVLPNVVDRVPLRDDAEAGIDELMAWGLATAARTAAEATPDARGVPRFLKIGDLLDAELRGASDVERGRVRKAVERSRAKLVEGDDYHDAGDGKPRYTYRPTPSVRNLIAEA